MNFNPDLSSPENVFLSATTQPIFLNVKTFRTQTKNFNKLSLMFVVMTSLVYDVNSRMVISSYKESIVVLSSITDPYSFWFSLNRKLNSGNQNRGFGAWPTLAKNPLACLCYCLKLPRFVPMNYNHAVSLMYEVKKLKYLILLYAIICHQIMNSPLHWLCTCCHKRIFFSVITFKFTESFHKPELSWKCSQ